MKVGILGGTGPQGRGLARRLAAAGHDVLIGSRSAERAELIAAELAISEGTVKTHMKSILPKLDASDRTHAVMIALKRGILDL